MSELFDAPNQQAVGLDPPWVEGEGGSTVGEEPAEAPAAQETAGEYDAMTKADLIALAQERGVSPANNDMTKAELIAALEAG